MATPLAGRTFNVGDADVQDNWDKKIWRQYIHRTVLFNPANKLVGDNESDLIQRKKESFQEGGTRATITLVKQLQGMPTYGAQTMEDREEGVDTETYRWEINKVRHAVAVDGEIHENRVSWNVIKTSSMLLGEWFGKVHEYGGSMQLTGFNINANRPVTEPFLNGTDLGLTWGNAPARPDATHNLYVNDKIPGNFTDTDIIDVEMIDDCIALASTYPQPLRPLRLYGDDYYLLLVHPYAIRHWKQSGTRWWEIAKAAIQGGMVNGNPVIRGTAGIYENTLIMAWNYLPPCINDSTITAVDGTAAVTNTRMAVFCGQQALLYGVAKRYANENTIRKVERDKDYGDKVGVEAHTLGGLACPKFTLNSSLQRFSTIVLNGYAKDKITPA
jgi:N4-gp56 family major capsid protein